MEYIIVLAVVFFIYKLIKGKSKKTAYSHSTSDSGRSDVVGRCKHCDGEVVPTAASGYAYRCRNCAERFKGNSKNIKRL